MSPTARLPRRATRIDLARFKAAVIDGLLLADLAQRFGLSPQTASKLRKKVMADTPGWRAKTGPRL